MKNISEEENFKEILNNWLPIDSIYEYFQEDYQNEFDDDDYGELDFDHFNQG